MFNVIELKLATGEEPTIVFQEPAFTEALVSVALIAEQLHSAELRPLVNGAVTALKPYGTSQAWELRVDGERTSILAIQEEEDE